MLPDIWRRVDTPLVPCAATHGNITPAVCSDVGNGAQLAQNILQLYRNPELCKRMSDNAVRLYTERYAKGIGLNKYVALLKNVLRTAN